MDLIASSDEFDGFSVQTHANMLSGLNLLEIGAPDLDTLLLLEISNTNPMEDLPGPNLSRNENDYYNKSYSHLEPYSGLFVYIGVRNLPLRDIMFLGEWRMGLG